MKQALVLIFALALPARSYADANADQAEKAVVMMEQVASLIDANKDNCDGMGDKLGAWTDANAAQLKQLNEAGKKLTAEQKQAFSSKYQDRLKALGSKMSSGLQKCSGNAKVTAAMKKVTAR
ncbi:hypothetical protein BH11MYX1_BH11MYX1_09080 [soil metagenome]